MKRHMDDVKAFEKIGFTNQQAHALTSLLRRVIAQFTITNVLGLTLIALLGSLVVAQFFGD